MRLNRTTLVLSLLALLMGCNSLIDVEEEYPLRSEDEQVDDNNSENNSVNNDDELDDCARLAVESYPQVRIEGNECIRADDVVEICSEQLRECRGIDGPGGDQLTCEEAQQLYDSLSESGVLGDQTDFTQDELLEACLMYGPTADERLTEEECVRLNEECELIIRN